ncbi:MAG: Eco57I restriction-modification methylase domain-containing protein, partial [Thermoleophilia bacterium]|nr:Eco57I restriction-modification methylase domain-containing protein [Thermoleophilia bacterium]
MFSRLGFETTGSPAPVDKEAVGFAPGDAETIQNLFLLADLAGTYQILLLELSLGGRSRLRSIAQNFLRRAGNYLLIATEDYETITFANLRRQRTDSAAPKAKIHKLTVDLHHPTRYDLEILNGLSYSGQMPLDLYRNHCEAFNVDRATNRFYGEYGSLFRKLCTEIAEQNPDLREFGDPTYLHAFTQRLLGRLMFLYFLQKKGWLDGDQQFLTRHYQRESRRQNNYYRTVLEPLFFEVLNQERDGDASALGDVPYLNGGLFDRDYEFDIALDNSLFDPQENDTALGLFNRYNFTVEEDTPLEIDVALDPELLGKVFENMLEENDRGNSGTFYTPRPVVHFMCREALLNYLEEQTPIGQSRMKEILELTETADAISGGAGDTTSTDNEPPTVAEAEAIENAIEAYRVLDPAVGTAAFPVAMLQELVALRRLCFIAKGAEVQRTGALMAEWKRHIISENLYGVDIKREAIEIAKLRLWLSLIVDLERDQVEPLPNLDYKMMVGDSLIESIHGEPIIPEANQQIDLLSDTQTIIEQLHQLKDEYFQARPDERRELRERIIQTEADVVFSHIRERRTRFDEEKNDIKKRREPNGKLPTRFERRLKIIEQMEADLAELEQQALSGEGLPFFLYRLHFGEVFSEKGGFDTVIANPPYVRHERLGSYKDILKIAYPDVYRGVADLFVYFYSRGLNLLREGGVLAFVSSNKFYRAGYGDGLRLLLSDQTTLQYLIDFGDLPVFDAAAYPQVLIAVKLIPNEDHAVNVLRVRERDQVEEIEATVTAEAQPLYQANLRGEGWVLESPHLLVLLDKIRSGGTPLGEYIGGNFYRGVLTGLNKAFIIDQQKRDQLIAEDPKSAEIIKPYLRGRDVKRWHAEWVGYYLIFTRRGIDIESYPAVMKHLNRWIQLPSATRGRFKRQAAVASVLLKRPSKRSTCETLRAACPRAKISD